MCRCVELSNSHSSAYRTPSAVRTMLKMTSHILFMCTRVRNCGYLTSQTFYLSVEIHLFFYPLILPPSYIIADLDLRINTVRNFVCNRFWTQLTKCSTVWLSSVFKAERAIGKVLQTYQRRSPGFCALFHTVRVARNFFVSSHSKVLTRHHRTFILLSCFTSSSITIAYSSTASLKTWRQNLRLSKSKS